MGLDNGLESGTLMPMRRLIVLSWLGLIGWGWAEEIKPVVPVEPKVRLTKLAEALLGKNGGNQLFYFPTHDVPATPKDWGFEFEEVWFRSKDGTRLSGWFVPTQGKLKGEAKATVVFSHGNTGSIGHHLGFCLWLVDAGYNVLTYDYRGFGKSAGRVDRRGTLDDVRAAFDYVAKRVDGDAGRLVSMGHSLGGASTLVALSEAPVKGLRAVVTDAAFLSYRAMARRIAGEVGGNLVSDEWSPKDWVAKIAPVPLLMIHGTDDELVPFAQGRQLFAVAAQPKTMFEVKGGRHGDSLLRNEGAYRKKLLAWLDEQLKK